MTSPILTRRTKRVPTMQVQFRDPDAILSIDTVGRPWFRDSHACTKRDTAPQLQFTNVPANTACIAVEMYDTTAGFTHWLAWSVDTPAEDKGVNSYGTRDYRAPCPPADGKVHSYVISAYALPGVPSVRPTHGAFQTTVKANALASATMTVLYQKTRPRTAEQRAAHV